MAIAGQHPGGARHEQRPNFNYFTLTGPNRLVIDLKGASNATNLARIENKSELVRKIRESTPAGRRAACDWCWISALPSSRWSSRWRRQVPMATVW